jgi:hypothetical protein
MTDTGTSTLTLRILTGKCHSFGRFMNGSLHVCHFIHRCMGSMLSIMDIFNSRSGSTLGRLNVADARIDSLSNPLDFRTDLYESSVRAIGGAHEVLRAALQGSNKLTGVLGGDIDLACSGCNLTNKRMCGFDGLGVSTMAPSRSMSHLFLKDSKASSRALMFCLKALLYCVL